MICERVGARAEGHLIEPSNKKTLFVPRNVQNKFDDSKFTQLYNRIRFDPDFKIDLQLCEKQYGHTTRFKTIPKTPNLKSTR